VCTTSFGTHRYDIQVLATHTRVKMGASIFFTAAVVRAFRSARSNGLVCRRVLCVLCTKRTMHSNHRLTRFILAFQHTKRLLPPGAAIFSLYTLASPSGRNVNYDEKQLTGKRFFELFLLSV